MGLYCEFAGIPSLYYDPPLHEDVYRLILTTFEHAKDFPRDRRGGG